MKFSSLDKTLFIQSIVDGETNLNYSKSSAQKGTTMAIAAARSVFRSSTVRSAATRLASQAKSAPSPSPFRLPSRTPLLAHRIFRSPAELSACVESMQPFHTATASALMTSMLTVSRFGYGWLAEVNCVSSDVESSFADLALTRLDEGGTAKREYLGFFFLRTYLQEDSAYVLRHVWLLLHE
ncbi:hypothetical protein SASPL_130049 [Salvia splendens]|uniref:Protein NUCLEAR FUSION DEFECTIVE 6, chloroplastic/mitochondrial-like n=1 Tax=Salvia splendens TaxID=180675 RepID=A0A8X8ZJ97_SALSN|nr:hypothetical protein SASPL_130049 [Salvia splendens]